MSERGRTLGGAVFLAAALAVTGIADGHAGTAGWDGAERIEVAAGNAERGPWMMNDSHFDYVDDPTVAIAADGHVGVAWGDQVRQNIFFQMYTPTGDPRFEEPVNVSNHPDIFSWLPRMVIPPDDPERIYVLWQEIVFSGGSHGGEIFFARSTDGGETFSAALNLSNSEAGAGKGRLTAQRWDNGSLDLAQGPDGRLYAAWTEYEGRLHVSHSTDGGASFSAPLHVAGDDARPARAPSLAVDSGGRVNLAWTVGEDPAADIRIATSGDGAESFSEPRIAAAGSGHADAPKLVADSQNRLHLVYGESTEGPLEQYRLRYARQDAGADGFSEAREIVAPQGGVDSVNFPDLAVDGADRLHLLWERFSDRRHFSDGLGYTLSEDGGASFATPTVVPGSGDPAFGFNGSLQGFLMSKLAVDEAGALALVNSTFAPEESSHIWLWRKPAGAR